MESKLKSLCPSDETPCSAFSGTPETDAQTRHSWVWDTRAIDYHPGGIVVDVDLARKLERERNEWRERCEHMQIACKVWSDQVDALNRDRLDMRDALRPMLLNPSSPRVKRIWPAAVERAAALLNSLPNVKCGGTGQQMEGEGS